MPGESIPTVSEIIGQMEMLAPPALAADWDNCGLQVGGRDWPVRRLWVALDPRPEVVAAACADGAGMLVTHHPLIFRPLSRVDTDTSVGRRIETALAARLAIYSAHTNLDSAADGLNDLLARRLAITSEGPLEPAGDGAPGCGLGRLGRLATATTLAALAETCRRRLELPAVKIAGNPELPVRRVALCTGSGGSLIGAFLDGPAEVYITGDLRYHDAGTVTDAGRGLIDIGHFGSERIMIADVADRLRQALAQRDVTVVACDLEREPFVRVGG